MINYYLDGFYERLNTSRWRAMVGQEAKVFNTEKEAQRWIYNESEKYLVWNGPMLGYSRWPA